MERNPGRELNGCVLWDPGLHGSCHLALGPDKSLSQAHPPEAKTLLDLGGQPIGSYD